MSSSSLLSLRSLSFSPRRPLSALSRDRTHRWKGTYAIAFDLDGVMYCGRSVVPQSKYALTALEERGIPWIFLTNGGGVTEEEKASALSLKLSHPIDHRRLQQAHTPLRTLVPHYRDRLILAFGSAGAKNVALHYGFKNVLSTSDVHSAFPPIYPEKKPSPSPANIDPNVLRDARVEALFGFLDPPDFQKDLQICFDLARHNGHFLSPSPSPSPSPPLPLYFCGPDFFYMSDWPSPRFGAGVFSHILCSVYKEALKKDLPITYFGKPYRPTFEYAESLLSEQGKEMGVDVTTIYMIGDNPETDIKGANGMGGKWRSVLVRTGVFHGGENDRENPASLVADNVGEAVDMIHRLHHSS
jgi:HAD superfamily hydrolase (TIGR01456 family)